MAFTYLRDRDKLRPDSPDWVIEQEDGFDIDAYEVNEDGDFCISSQQVFDLCRVVEHHRKQIVRAEAQLLRWLRSSPDFAKFWDKFQSVGGVDSDDFRNFLAGTMRYRTTKQRKHLRMVVNRKPIRRVRLRPTGNDAA